MVAISFSLPSPYNRNSQILESYNGVVNFSLVLFIIHIFVKTAMIYSSLAVSVAITSVSPNDEVVLRDEASVSTFSSRPRSADGTVRSVRSSEPYTPDSKRKVTFHSEEDVDEPNVDGLHPPFTPGVPGLVSPGYCPKSDVAVAPPPR